MTKLLLMLFYRFTQIGLFSIGGGYATIPLIQEQVVELEHWLTLQEFTDIITISQMTPGPLAVNTSTFTGLRIAGIPGAVTATIGCILSGFIISIFLYRFFNKYRSNRYLFQVLNGLKAVSAGLIASSAGVILLIAFCGTSELDISALHPDIFACCLFGACLLLLRKWKWNPIPVMVLSGIAGYFIY